MKINVLGIPAPVRHGDRPNSILYSKRVEKEKKKKHVAWSDESRFQLNQADGCVRVWGQLHESMDPTCQQGTVQAGGGSVRVWGACSWRDMGSLIHLDTTLTGIGCKKKEQGLEPNKKENGPRTNGNFSLADKALRETGPPQTPPVASLSCIRKFTCRNCGGGDRGRVAIYRPFGEVSLSLNRTVTCMVLKANDRRTSCPCHDEFRGPRSDYVRQVALATTTTTVYAVLP
ncbi:uncharacterized protein TNCV_490041 [Trichonephila clavipes]|nr:uncharacterized protein TNCV_490041 [Trichonephila clavipes]